mmetsp:Transcript_93625/g.166591  ORF Transcript_93625/g.166591 Transcript_93625/m.166591 type:complete len:498 (+) Transcript_93625:66-1559(+)|eukprot:CAMPEP_0197628976 /NCGR_PEP_ID=MMETSP1338-20131121/7035_1 /TAXON_ID=43686 ORGANISM="Pelagodinium beii, Strain RCC1491" /NCGR_SAMPLE_ID=MMETSP1338 /ASSEMBLY_ACC=CAM_ASM_000754 /LENGTH=497 /DNA_ID=CAMNT_0043199981 /DNA_START=66 /DNA_END=1559 /DNA_ORIENTATION=-
MKMLTPRTSVVHRGTPESNSWTRRQTHWKGVKATKLAAAQSRMAIVKPLTLVGGGDKPERQPLSTSLTDAAVPARDGERIQSTYHWRPIQVKEHEDRSNHDPGYTFGTYVNTLSYNISVQTLSNAKPLQIRLEPKNFTPQGSLWCYLAGDGMIICQGVVIGACPKIHDPENGRNIRIARLPVEARPRRGLQFAALSREAYDVGGHVTYTSSLVTLTVTPDGWICGVSRNEMEGAIDLSAVRFCINGGISLTDEVSIHTADIGHSRLVCLQGTLSDRFFVVDSKKPLAMLPESCRPPEEIPFIVSGSGPGSFNLMIARPLRGGGIGGDLMWRDGVWNHDVVHTSGIMYEVAADAMPFSLVNASWAPEILMVFVGEFQKFLVAKFGSIEDAWEEAFDTDGSGEINFTEFSLGCKKAGYVGNATRLWAALDEDRGGSISLDELQADKFVDLSYGRDDGAQPPPQEGQAQSLAGMLEELTAEEEFTLPGMTGEQTQTNDGY